jgi:Flp pilus assembly protein TadD
LRKQQHRSSAYILRSAVTATKLPTAESLSQPLFERGLDLLAAGSPAEAAQAFRAAVAAGPEHIEAHHGLIRALRDAGQFNQSVAAAMALTALTPSDPLAHTALSISLQHAGHVPQAEAAAHARVLEWKIQLQSPPGEDFLP